MKRQAPGTLMTYNRSSNIQWKTNAEGSTPLMFMSEVGRPSLLGIKKTLICQPLITYIQESQSFGTVFHPVSQPYFKKLPRDIFLSILPNVPNTWDTKLVWLILTYSKISVLNSKSVKLNIKKMNSFLYLEVLIILALILDSMLLKQ